MIVEEILGFLSNLVPYLNAGTLALIINLALERLGFRITKREFKKKPMRSLFRGLCLIFVSSLVAILVQTRLSGLGPFLVFVVLFIIYLAITQV